jgi:hypothetical protein
MSSSCSPLPYPNDDKPNYAAKHQREPKYKLRCGVRRIGRKPIASEGNDEETKP